MRYLELASLLPLGPRLRVRVALDVLEHASEPGATNGGAVPRVTVADVLLEPSGRARLARPVASQRLPALLWEVLACQVADTDDLPWADPADDLHPEVHALFASLALRPPTSAAELTARFVDACSAHACEHPEVRAAMHPGEARPALATPVVAADAEPGVTTPAPPMALSALRAMSALDEPSHGAQAPSPSAADSPADPADSPAPPAPTISRAAPAGAWKPLAPRLRRPSRG